MSAGESEDVRQIVRGLERKAPARTSGGLARLLRFPAAGLTRSPVFQLAAAAVLVLVVGFAVQTTRDAPPQLPDSAVDTVVRGGEVEAVSPVGEIAATADAFVWRPVEGAVTYTVTLKAVDDTILWETTSSETSAAPPDSLRASLHRAVTYRWRVEALDSDGLRIAGSAWTEFRARPEPGRD